MNPFSAKSSSASSQLKSNIKYSLVIKVLHVILNLFMVRYCISLAGKENYGFWLTFLSIFTLFSCIEVGLNNGYRKSLTKFYENKDEKSYKSTIQDMFGQATIHYLPIFTLVSISILLLPINQLLSIDFIEPFTLKATLIICGAMYTLHYILFTINTVFLCIHKAKDSFMWFFLQSFFQIMSLWVLSLLSIEIDLVTLCLVMCTAPALVWLMAFFYYNSSILKKPQVSLFLKNWKSRFLNDKSTILFFVLQLALLVLLSTDNILILKIVSPSEVTSYQVALKYFNILVIVFNTVLVPFWAAFTKASHTNSTDWISKKMKQLLFFWLVMALASLVMLYVSNFVYSLWIGKQLGISMILSITVAIYTLQTLWNAMYSYYLYSIEKIEMQTKLYVVAALINLPLSFFLGSNYGVVGIISGSIFSFLPLSIYLPIKCKNALILSNEK